jgi:CRISPR-associated exonuclease Cas4
MQNITATHINIYHICHRELWLHANEIRMESGSDIVAEGKLIGETTYEDRPSQYTEVAVDGIKIDFYDHKLGVVHEVKKSDKLESAYIAQVKYYLYKLEQNSILANYGILEYPKTRKTVRIDLSDTDRTQIPLWEADIRRIVALERCPAVIKKPFCKSCSYHDFCYISEG